VNGQPIKKHLLQNEDMIAIGKYKVHFFVEAIQPIINANASIPLAKIKKLNDNNAGREMILSKQITNLGNPKVLVVAIMREKSGYFVKFVGGISAYCINEVAMNK
jgi:pSer/pThr/pTyr-binding forkhead associated (FHA) protein